MSQQWYVQLDDIVIGPMTSSEFQNLAHHGAIQPSTQVSHDQSNWYRAGRLRGLEFGSVTSAATPVKDSAQRPSISTPSEEMAAATGSRSSLLLWLGLGSFAALGILLLTCCGFASLAFQTPSAPTGPTSATQDAFQQTARATYDYWNSVKSILRSARDDGTAQQIADAILRTTQQIDQLPVQNVDPVAARCALSLCETLRVCAQSAKRQNDPTILVEAVARGLSGDPFGKSLELMQETRQVHQRLEANLNHVRQVRVELSQKYGVEFPSWTE